MSDDTTARALRALDRIDDVGTRTRDAALRLGVPPEAWDDGGIADALAVARAAVIHRATMIARHPELENPALADLPTVEDLLRAIAALAGHAPDGGDDELDIPRQWQGRRPE